MTLTPGANIQVTHDSNPNNDRSESALAVNPQDANNMVGSSKRFTDPATYAFALSTYNTFDGGSTWTESMPAVPSDWAGTSDPAVAFDRSGNAYLLALPFGPGANAPLIGIAIYRSTDSGRTWGAPQLIHQSSGDDKQELTSDTYPNSPFYGNVYGAWDDGTPTQAALRFARTTDLGQTWRGAGSDAVGTGLADDSFSPSLTVAPDGTLYIVWTNQFELKFVRSTDGGETFSDPAVIASGITSLDAAGLNAPDGFPELPGGTFRVDTIPAAVAGPGGSLVVAWADYRENVSRIYCRRSGDGGQTWDGSPSGDPLLTGTAVSDPTLHDFHPQLAVTPAGVIGCAFYEFGRMPTTPLINVVMVASYDGGKTFIDRVTVTDHPWDPAVDAPLSHGSSTTTFIGDYFGLAAGPLGYFPFWTDTRTGIQEIFTARVTVS
ncbi:MULTISPECIES: sialidase family protein [unclassified Nocardia]|uniref:sialidase family protein n=1 Tax=unclassified Nocardia TaxID=2637762 RepID=UPI001CE493AE|nr:MULTISPECIES: sialidase family protein [unclassified Nocardia]